jgi:hypothetical protein
MALFVIVNQNSMRDTSLPISSKDVTFVCGWVCRSSDDSDGTGGFCQCQGQDGEDLHGRAYYPRLLDCHMTLAGEAKGKGRKTEFKRI